MSLLMIFEILGLFVNTLTPDDKYCFVIWKINRNQFKSNYLRKEKSFPNFLLNLWDLYHILNILKQKITPSLMYYGKYGLPKTWFDKSLSSVSGQRSTVKMLQRHKGCWNLHGSTLIIFSHYFDGNRVGKCLS